MNNLEFLNLIYTSLCNGDLSLMTSENIQRINSITVGILQDTVDNTYEDELILKISNILYNNTDRELLPLEDGLYDLLLEKYRLRTGGKLIIGAPPINFNKTEPNTSNSDKEQQITTPINPIQILENRDEMIFYDSLSRNKEIDLKYPISPIEFNNEQIKENPYITKRLTNTSHDYPELVGTLNKSKFVLISQAREKGVENDPNVRILERDFFGEHIKNGILDPNRIFSVILELKYDGISVEATVSNRILSARTRGDAVEDIAADLTPILYDYPFKNALGLIPDDEIFGIKFEAIITKDNLIRFNQMKGKDYKNCRTAIIGLTSSSDAYKYRNLITLVPLASSLNLRRDEEIEFLNMFYANDEYLRYAIVTGNYVQVLFQIKRFVEEAEMMRDFLPFMYDGVVVSYLDEDLRKSLGRKNAVNLYSEAVKFNPLKKQTIFRGYSYTVGQDYSITPMIHYDPVEFFGTIHANSTGHSYERFKELQLRIGDIIDVEYVNDVMPYVTKPDNSHNANNPNPIVEFTKECPACGCTELRISDTGKTIYCTNKDCKGVKLARMVNMMQKLNLKDFGESHLERINKYSLRELASMTLEEARQIFPGERMAEKFMERINELMTKPIEDYQIVGSLGFTSIAKSTWKLILKNYTLDELLSMDEATLMSKLTAIKGIGSTKASVIIEELPYFMEDLLFITKMNNVYPHKYNNKSKIIRFTGVRDSELVEKLTEMGHDAGEGSVTKDTNILIVPNASYESSKVKKARTIEGIQIVPIDEFRNNIDRYL